MTFFEDFQKLKQKSAHLGLRGFKNTGCEYNDYLYFSKNCYMCVHGDYFEHCMYCIQGKKCKYCGDCSVCDLCELCYECVNCHECYNGVWLQDCRRVSDSMFCYDCIGCSNCFGCAGLRQQQHTLFNKKLSEEEYEKGVVEWKAKGMDAIFAEFEKIKESVPHQHMMNYRIEDSTGDHLQNAQRCVECFDADGVQDCGYVYFHYNVYGERTVDTWDVTSNVDLNQCYQCIQVGKGYNCSFCYYCEVTRDCDYCFQVFNSKNCFGCVSVNHGEYMILNEKYSPEDYEKKKAEIIEEMKASGEWGKWPILEGERFDAG
ncbi:hypothetical protein HOG17_01420 [Candidatus Peregrinibacteria bacterium]|jgi:hypothetical protein|nr:hypothetical protein [Candidatus Peregrinibacteria bacterium]MBT4148392.1 hypothetical protein [Candidatus Peregrinibacteria bacterium]MBT4365878.1 hypothetical protein [Candidatus Peregrinibacteria bacterium]MBT4456509.1 hypothetical protein [Candidatus Peregrinibacteria bacterium]